MFRAGGKKRNSAAVTASPPRASATFPAELSPRSCSGSASRESSRRKPQPNPAPATAPNVTSMTFHQSIHRCAPGPSGAVWPPHHCSNSPRTNPAAPPPTPHSASPVANRSRLANSTYPSPAASAPHSPPQHSIRGSGSKRFEK